MKRIIIPVMALIALMSMSFTTNSSSLEIVKTENGNYLKNAQLLTLDDLETLQQITVIGRKETTLVKKSVKNDWVNETVFTSKDKKRGSRSIKLEAILSKY